MSRASGVSEEKLRALSRYRESAIYSEEERLAIEYAEHMTQTTVEVPEELFSALKRRFSERQIVELTAAIAWENFRARMNHALEIEAQGFSEGASCELPGR